MRRFQRVAPKQPINEDIRHKELRVVSELGQFGVISLNRALYFLFLHQESSLKMLFMERWSNPMNFIWPYMHQLRLPRF